MTPPDARQAWLEREIRAQLLVQIKDFCERCKVGSRGAKYREAEDHAWDEAMKYVAQRLPDVLMPALAALVAAPLREMEEALVIWARSQEEPNGPLCWCSDGDDLSGMQPEDHAKACQQARAALARLPWRGEGKPCG